MTSLPSPSNNNDYNLFLYISEYWQIVQLCYDVLLFFFSMVDGVTKIAQPTSEREFIPSPEGKT